MAKHLLNAGTKCILIVWLLTAPAYATAQTEEQKRVIFGVIDIAKSETPPLSAEGVARALGIDLTHYSTEGRIEERRPLPSLQVWRDDTSLIREITISGPADTPPYEVFRKIQTTRIRVRVENCIPADVIREALGIPYIKEFPRPPSPHTGIVFVPPPPGYFFSISGRAVKSTLHINRLCADVLTVTERFG